jgi:hypothetical protein
MRRFLSFAAKVAAAHALTYFVVGATAYAFLTKPLYEGPDPLFASFMRTPADPVAWRHVMIWFLPAQLLRGLLMAIALYPFYATLLSWSVAKRFVAIAGIYLVFGYWACAVAAPGTIDGLVYMRPEFTARAHLLVQPEIVVQGAALALLVAWWMGRGARSQSEREAAALERASA